MSKSSIIEKHSGKLTRRTVFRTLVGYTLLITGCVIFIHSETTNTYKKTSLSVIYTSYENGVCLFKTDCLNKKSDNGCKKYYSRDNAYTFKCSYLNVVFGYQNNGTMMCSINKFEKGFNYPELGEVWYNSTYAKFYNLVSVGDKVDVWYSENEGKCVLDIDKTGYAAGIIILIMGLVIIFMNCINPVKNKVAVQDESYVKKSTNFINVNVV